MASSPQVDVDIAVKFPVLVEVVEIIGCVLLVDEIAVELSVCV
jgi:hypothetical protein